MLHVLLPWALQFTLHVGDLTPDRRLNYRNVKTKEVVANFGK